MGRVLHASRSGYFTSCFYSTNDTGPKPIVRFPGFGNAEAVYPVGLTLENAMKIFWRLKKFNIEYDGNVIPIEMTSFTGNVWSEVGVQRPPITDETQYVCLPKQPSQQFAPIVHTRRQDKIFSSPPSKVFDFNFTIFESSLPVAINPSDQENLYYPYLVLWIRYSDADNPSENIWVQLSQSYNAAFDAFYAPTGHFLDFFGIAHLPLFKWPLGTYKGVPVTFRATEYWSYDGLYDTTTGELL